MRAAAGLQSEAMSSTAARAVRPTPMMVADPGPSPAGNVGVMDAEEFATLAGVWDDQAEALDAAMGRHGIAARGALDTCLTVESSP